MPIEDYCSNHFIINIYQYKHVETPPSRAWTTKKTSILNYTDNLTSPIQENRHEKGVFK